MQTPAKSTDTALKVLEQASAGLLFPSETDAPFSPYRYPGPGDPSPAALLRALAAPAGTRVEEIGIDELFEGVTTPPEGSDENDAELARWQSLVDLLKAELAEPRVYRVGDTDIDVYVLGRAPSGEWIGLKTHVVET